MNKFMHYGAEVTVQSLAHSFEDDLKKEGIEYVELPLLENKVLRYCYNGKKRYAYITYPNVAEEYAENVYITEEIPDDMNWDNIERDYRAQMDGEEPMLLATRARVLYDAAYKMACDNPVKEPDGFLAWMQGPSKKELDLALITLGTSLQELREADHHDVPELDEE